MEDSFIQDIQKVKKIELKYKKLLTEYNAILIALATVTMGIGGLVYTITNNILLSLFGLAMSFLILNTEKYSKSQELDNKINEL